ncbi:hypothetical protein CRD60_01045 [Bifidobacterium aemilianum]|uniref:Helix-turn-helix domain-containing protein n=1 Tax=Bifidobacterium aemilianum TaxID=2493120 RepID=A0A366KBI8_9BIFI|nr:hypothetical protein [Bifidobacterium aemilianum]RBP98483.1 hypothetical protein CRD60_01045 [Bifidobacterium aemilianum]
MAAQTVDVSKYKRLTLRALGRLSHTKDYPSEEWRVKQQAEELSGGPIADSTIRSRLKELTRIGHVVEVDRKGRSKGGNACTRYQLADMEVAA